MRPRSHRLSAAVPCSSDTASFSERYIPSSNSSQKPPSPVHASNTAKNSHASLCSSSTTSVAGVAEHRGQGPARTDHETPRKSLHYPHRKSPRRRVGKTARRHGRSHRAIVGTAISDDLRAASPCKISTYSLRIVRPVTAATSHDHGLNFQVEDGFGGSCAGFRAAGGGEKAKLTESVLPDTGPRSPAVEQPLGDGFPVDLGFEDLEDGGRYESP